MFSAEMLEKVCKVLKNPIPPEIGYLSFVGELPLFIEPEDAMESMKNAGGVKGLFLMVLAFLRQRSDKARRLSTEDILQYAAEAVRSYIDTEFVFKAESINWDGWKTSRYPWWPLTVRSDGHIPNACEQSLWCAGEKLADALLHHANGRFREFARSLLLASAGRSPDFMRDPILAKAFSLNEVRSPFAMETVDALVEVFDTVFSSALERGETETVAAMAEGIGEVFEKDEKLPGERMRRYVTETLPAKLASAFSRDDGCSEEDAIL